MASPEIGELFDDDRFPSGLKLFPILLYFPFGLILAMLRLFIGFHAFLVSCFLPKMTTLRSLVLRSMCAVLGVVVTTDGMQHRNNKAKVLVANYTSTLDHLATDLVIPCVLPSVWDLPPTLMWLLGYKDMGAGQGREVLIRNATKHTTESKVPLLVFPEGASTNSRKGLLKFSVWPFSLGQPLQPLVIRITRPSFTQISPSILGGRWWIDIFWFIFVPYSCFHIKMLPVVEEGGDEAVEEFTCRVQQLIASSLGVAGSNYTSADKVEYTKRKLFIQPPCTPQQQQQQQKGSGIEVMVYQVKEVLPHVPAGVIRADLALTKDVDLTITNILAGRVQYTAEPLGVDASPSSPANTQATAQRPSAAAAAATMSSFARDPKLRAMSLEERKQALIEYARLKYKQKHGLL